MYKSSVECYEDMIKTINKRTLMNSGKKKITASNYSGNEDLVDYLQEKYNIPESISSDVIFNRDKTVATRSDFILYAFADGLDSLIETNFVHKYFTENEIKRYNKLKYKEEKINFPYEIPFKMSKVDEDQWIGGVDVDFFMLLRKANLIRYNPDTQRPLQILEKVMRDNKGTQIGRVSTYAIYLIEKSWQAIKKRFHEKTYIPTAITLNMPPDEYPDFYYDEETATLTINNLDHFDMLDGYHRYFAMCQEKSADPKFNAKMILQITNFSDFKAKNFIYQEDQKTKLNKNVSKTFDMSKIENFIAEMLNKEPEFIWRGQITRSREGLINMGDFCECINFFYIKPILRKGKTIDNVLQLRIRKSIINATNEIASINPDIFSKHLGKKELVLLFCIIEKKRNDEEYINAFDEYCKKISHLNLSMLSKPNIDKIKELCDIA